MRSFKHNYILNYYERNGGAMKGSILLQGYKVKRMATEKANSLVSNKEDLLITADTIVVRNRIVFHKFYSRWNRINFWIILV